MRTRGVQVRWVSAISLAILGVSGCTAEDTDPVVDDTFDDLVNTGDADHDGITEEDGDCDDSDPAIRPGRTDLCNGIDDNCNDLIDEGNSDADGDGLCDGQDLEDCDGVDNDGDGAIDEGFPDEDFDGEADCAGDERCDGLDNDGDGLVDEGFDLDGDLVTTCAGDCDDGNEDIRPGATENDANAIDDDCDGFVDEGAWSAGDLVISEVMINPQAVSDPNGEWFEVVNASGRTLILDGLVVSSGNDQSALGQGALGPLAPGDYVVIGWNPVTLQNGGVVLDGVLDGVRFDNTADTLVLSYGGETVDAVSWADASAYVGVSMELTPGMESHLSNDVDANWCPGLAVWGPNADRGTPGEANESCSIADDDDDGFSLADGDCDDSSDEVYPGAPEINPALDNDCDGDVEWAPTAVAVLDGGSSAEECGVLVLDGTGSTDPEGDLALTYEWTLDSAPPGSNATLSSDEPVAEFVPDVDGDYAFSLVVRDSGESASLPDILEVTVDPRLTNSAPVAEAGQNQSESDTATCISSDCRCDGRAYQLGGGGSFDADGDPITYRWDVVAGEGLLSASSIVNPVVELPGLVVPNTVGASESQVTFVALVVTDCLGLESVQDVVALTMTCDR